MDSQQNDGGTLLAEQKWAVFQLNDPRETDAEDLGKCVITTDDFEQEIFDGRIFDRDDAERLVATHNGAIDFCTSQADGVR